MKRIINVLLISIVAIIVGVLVGLPFYNKYSIENETELLFEKKSKAKQISFTSSNFSLLPSVVKKYLRKNVNNISNPPRYSKYSVFGKTKHDQNSEWLEFSSENYYSAVTPEFIKIGDAQSTFPFWTTIVEKYLDNVASTNSKFMSSIITYDFTGSKLRRSYLVLYLMESIFCPTVLFPNMNVQWDPIDNSKARATIWDEDLNGTAVFRFNKNDEVIKIVTDDRYMHGDLDYEREKFTIHFTNYQNVGDFNIPTYFEYQWNLASGDVTVGRFQISEILYE